MEINHIENSPSWQSIIREALRTKEDIEKFFGIETVKNRYPIFIPLPYAYKIKEAGENSALWNQFIPQSIENDQLGPTDPISDHTFQRPGGIIHRYRNRVLFSPTDICPIQCRYCFRKNELHQNDELFRGKVKQALEYLSHHPEVEEVILTGGDPLMLSNERLDHLFKEFLKINSIKMIRIHSRMPIIVPQRIIDKGFIETLKKYQFKYDLISLVIHTNHISEWSLDFLKSLEFLHRTKINLMSQSVLLKGVNDNPQDLLVLFKTLSKNKIRPYYLHHPDKVRGGLHFHLSLDKGRDIYAEIKKELSGFMLPNYVIELPNGKGKAFAWSSTSDRGNLWIDKDQNLIEVNFFD